MDKTVRIILQAQDNSSGVLGVLGGKLQQLGLISDDFSKRLSGLSSSSVSTGQKLATLGQIASVALAAGMAVGFDKAVKSASEFQAGLVPLVASAGETQKNLDMVSKGIIAVADSTGYSAQKMVGPDGPMYQIESAGFHGANGLKVLAAAAQGARAENADLTKVADAVTSTLIDYHQPASAAADITSKLVAAVGAGKANFEQFTGALHSVLPIASAAHIPLNDILGDLASMTVHGMSADQATQNMANAIRTLQKPSQSASEYLAQLGITAADLSDHLSSKGLSGTLNEISQAIMAKMGPAGKVLVSSFNESKTAAADATQMISKMPSALQDLAKKYQEGKMTVGDYRKEIKELPTDQANLLQQFKALQDKAGGFNQLLKSGSPAALSYAQALQKATGNATTMNVALMLSGENAGYTANAIKKVGEAHATASGQVEGFAIWQQTLSAKMNTAKKTMENTGIIIGTAFLPLLTNLMNVFIAILTPIVAFVDQNQVLATVILGVVFAIAAFVATVSIIGKVAESVNGVKAAWMLLTTEGIRKAIVSTAEWVVQTVAKVAVIVATNVAGAAVTAGAWIVANAAMIGIWGVIIAVIIGAVVLIISHWKEISKFFVDLWKGISSFIAGVWNGIVKGITTAFNAIVTFLKQWGPTILAVMLFPFSIALGLIIMFWKPITAFFAQVVNAIKAIFTPIIGFYVKIFQAEVNGIIIVFKFLIGVFSTIKDAIVNVWNFFVGWFVKLWTLEVNGVVVIFNILLDFFKTVWTGIVAIFSPIIGWFAGVFRGAANAVTGAFNGIVGFFSGIWHSIVSIFTTIGGAVGGAISGAVRWAVNGVLSFAVGAINNFIGAIDTAIDVMNHIPGVHIGKIPSMGVPKFATGTDYFQGGVALVGEHGAELVSLPQGSKIMQHGATANALATGNGGGQTHYHINVNVGAYAGQPGEIDKLGEVIWQSFQRIARRHGQADSLPNIGVRPQ